MGLQTAHSATRGGASAARTIVAAEQAKRGQRQSHRVDAPRGRGWLVPSVGHQCERQIEGSNTLNAGLPAACGASPWLLGGRAGRGVGARLVGCTRAHSTQGPDLDFSLENWSTKGKALQNFSVLFCLSAPFFQDEKEGKIKNDGFWALCPACRDLACA